MPPRKSTRAKKSTAPSPAPLRELASAKARETLEHAEQAVAEEKADEEEAAAAEAASKTAAHSRKGKGKAKEVREQPAEEVPTDGVGHAVEEAAVASGEETSSPTKSAPSMTPEERLAKLKELRTRMVKIIVFRRWCSRCR
jgi:hypothetical protein